MTFSKLTSLPLFVKETPNRPKQTSISFRKIFAKKATISKTRTIPVLVRRWSDLVEAKWSLIYSLWPNLSIQHRFRMQVWGGAYTNTQTDTKILLLKDSTDQGACWVKSFELWWYLEKSLAVCVTSPQVYSWFCYLSTRTHLIALPLHRDTAPGSVGINAEQSQTSPTGQ